MAFKGITFAGQNVTPKNDGGLYQAHYGDGILWGCSMNISGDDLVIQSGEFIMGGRVVQVDGATNVDLSGRTLQTGYIQVIMNADLTQGEGSQWYITFVESATTTFPALTKDDINDTGTLYQLELAVVQISGGNLTAITSSVRPSYLITSPYIWINSGSSLGVNPTMRVYYDGDMMGQIYSDAGTDIRFANGQGIGKGLYLEPNYVTLWADGQPIYIRPNGGFSTTGQVYFGTDGQQIGGHSIAVASTAGNVSCPADTTTLLQSVAGLASSGVYLACASCSFTPSASTGIQWRFTLSTANDSYVNSLYTASTSGHFATVSGIFTGATSINFYARPFSGSVSGSANTRKIEITRLA